MSIIYATSISTGIFEIFINSDYFQTLVLNLIFGKIFGKFCKSFGHLKTGVLYRTIFDRQNFSAFDIYRKSKISGKCMALVKTASKKYVSFTTIFSLKNLCGASCSSLLLFKPELHYLTISLFVFVCHRLVDKETEKKRNFCLLS